MKYVQYCLFTVRTQWIFNKIASSQYNYKSKICTQYKVKYAPALIFVLHHIATSRQ